MKVLLVCRYCAYSWERNMYMGEAFQEKCWKCGDTNIDVKDMAKTKIDGYVGCPEFPEKKKEIKEENGNTDFPFHYGSD
jgi:hypothetical protein